MDTRRRHSPAKAEAGLTVPRRRRKRRNLEPLVWHSPVLVRGHGQRCQEILQGFGGFSGIHVGKPYTSLWKDSVYDLLSMGYEVGTEGA